MRKTRQQKIIAKLRRQLKTQSTSNLEPQSNLSERLPASPTAPTYKFEGIPLPTVKIDNKSVTVPFPQLIKKDLIRTLSISLVVTIIEVVLYLAIEKNLTPINFLKF